MALRETYARMKRAGYALIGAEPDTPKRPNPEAQIRVMPQQYLSSDANEQKLLSDDSVYAVYNIYSDILLGSGWRWEGKDAERLQPEMERLTTACGFTQLLEEIAAAPFQRSSAIEIVWTTEGRSWFPTSYRVLPAGTVQIDIDELGDVAKLTVLTTGGQQELPMTNAILHRWRYTFDKPLGASFYDRLKEVINYKRRGDVSLIQFVERWATPTLIGWYAPGMDQASVQKLLTALKALQSASVGTLPGPKGDAGNSIEMVEAKGQGGGTDLALDIVKWYERRIARGILGSVLAVFESEFGTRAQAETHAKVLQRVVESYQSDVEEPINKQLVQPFLAYNAAGADVKFRLNAPDFTDTGVMARMIADLAAAGFLDPANMEDQRQIRALFGFEGEPTIPEMPEAEPKAAEEAA